MSNITITASTVAWYGAVIGTLTGIKIIRDIYYDRGRLKINFQTGMFYLDNGKASADQVTITITNLSKRPAKITHIGARDLPEWNKASLYVNEGPRILTEKNPSTVYVKPQKDFNLKKLWFVYVIDARGKEYHRYLQRFGRLKWYQYKIYGVFRKTKAS